MEPPGSEYVRLGQVVEFGRHPRRRQDAQRNARSQITPRKQPDSPDQHGQSGGSSDGPGVTAAQEPGPELEAQNLGGILADEKVGSDRFNHLSAKGARIGGHVRGHQFRPGEVGHHPPHQDRMEGIEAVSAEKHLSQNHGPGGGDKSQPPGHGGGKGQAQQQAQQSGVAVSDRFSHPADLGTERLHDNRRQSGQDQDEKGSQAVETDPRRRCGQSRRQPGQVIRFDRMTGQIVRRKGNYHLHYSVLPAMSSSLAWRK